MDLVIGFDEPKMSFSNVKLVLTSYIIHIRDQDQLK